MPFFAIAAVLGALALFSTKKSPPTYRASGDSSPDAVKADLDRLLVDNSAIQKELALAVTNGDTSGIAAAMNAVGSTFQYRYPALTAYIQKKFPGVVQKN